MVELVDAPDLGSGVNRRESSSLSRGTNTGVMKLVDVQDLRSCDPKGRVGSSPITGTIRKVKQLHWSGDQP